MYTFQQVLSSMDLNTQENLTKLFDQWLKWSDWTGLDDFANCNHQRLIDNLKNDHFLPSEYMQTLLKELHDLLPNYQWPNLLRHWKDMIKEHYQLKGGTVDELPKVIGTALVKPFFIHKLVESKRFSKAEAEQLLNKKPNQLNRKEKELLIKAELATMWLTWDEFNGSDPYHFLEVTSGENIFTSMALPEIFNNREQLLFRFTYIPPPSPQDGLRKPTWCDSCFFDKFCPTQPSEETRWGLTDPPKSYPIKPNYNLKRPEGVLQAGRLPLGNLHAAIQTIPF